MSLPVTRFVARRPGSDAAVSGDAAPAMRRGRDGGYPVEFGPLAEYVADPAVTDIFANGGGGIWVDRGGGAVRVTEITLTADAGNSPNFAGQFFTPGTNFWTIAGGLTAPIFEGGTLLHRQRAAQAAFDQAQISVNGKQVGQHIGGYNGFSIDITSAISAGYNVVAVRLNNQWNAQIPPRYPLPSREGSLERSATTPEVRAGSSREKAREGTTGTPVPGTPLDAGGHGSRAGDCYLG